MLALPLTVTVRPSRHLRRVLTGLHLLAGCAVWLAALPSAAQAAGATLVLASLALSLRRHQAVTLRCGRHGELALRQGEAWRPLADHAAPLVLPGLTLLRYRIGTQHRPVTLAILADSLPVDDFRRLRVWLRWLGSRPKGAAPMQGPGATHPPLITEPRDSPHPGIR